MCFKLSLMLVLRLSVMLCVFNHSKKETMKRTSKSDEVEEKFLFHGTKAEYIDAICQQNFDWRIAGSSTGALYGEGSYFARDAYYARYFH